VPIPNEWPSGYYFGDGSGGNYSKYPTLRRAGVGLHYVNLDKVPMYNFWQPLPGPQQTVPRAELFALCLAVTHVHQAGVIDFFTDSLITANTFNKGPARARLANNADLWNYLFGLIQAKNILCRVYWMPSHTDSMPSKKKLAPSWMQDWHVKGNNAADLLANDGAAIHAIPIDKAQPTLDTFENLALIQNRIIHAIKMYPQRDFKKLISPKLQLSHSRKVESAIWMSKHALHIINNRVCCMHCHSTVSISAKHVFDFIKSSCVPREQYKSFAIGNLHTHPSHNVVIYGGVLFCTKCGCTGVNKAEDLVSNCKNILKPADIYGQNNIKRYKKGKSPAGFPNWPYDKFLVSDRTIIKSINSAVVNMRAKMLQRVEQEPESDNESSVSIPSGALSDLGSLGSSSD